jgi:hypothetical protein
MPAADDEWRGLGARGSLPRIATPLAVQAVAVHATVARHLEWARLQTATACHTHGRSTTSIGQGARVGAVFHDASPDTMFAMCRIWRTSRELGVLRCTPTQRAFVRSTPSVERSTPNIGPDVHPVEALMRRPSRSGSSWEVRQPLTVASRAISRSLSCRYRPA